MTAMRVGSRHYLLEELHGRFWVRLDGQKHKVKPDSVNQNQGNIYEDASRQSGDSCLIFRAFPDAYFSYQCLARHSMSISILL